jgi:hypothetical protein
LGAIGAQLDPSGTRFDLPSPPVQHLHDAVDMDGDHVADTVTMGDSSSDITFTVVRGDGTLTMSSSISPLMLPHILGGDDVDGDGHDELVIGTYGRTTFGLYAAELIVRGTTPPGTVAIDDVAYHGGALVGDVSGDGLDDVGGGAIGVPDQGYWSPAASFAADDAGLDPASIPSIANIADFDFDGLPDRIVNAAPDHSTENLLVLSTGPTLSLGGHSFGAAGAVRHGSASYVEMVDQVQRSNYRIRTGCEQAWLRAVTPVLVGRDPVASDRHEAGSETDPDAAVRTATALRLIRSNQGRGVLVTERFEELLGREVDRAGASYWVRALESGRRTPGQLDATLLGSHERVVRSGGLLDGWVRTAYDKALGRSPDPGGFSYWLGQAKQLGTLRAASRLLSSAEAHRYLARRYTQLPSYLGDTASAARLARGAHLLDTAGFDAFLSDLAGSDAVYLKAQVDHRLH